MLLANRLQDTDNYESEIITSDQDLSSVKVDWNLRALTLPSGDGLIIGSLPYAFKLGDQRVRLEQVFNRTGGHDECIIFDPFPITQSK